MQLHFHKYQGAGNDFVIVDDRAGTAPTGRSTVAQLCDRRFGIGADGYILLQEAEGYDFRMVYFNADGGESTLCGNGGRCIVAFAQHLGLVAESCSFLAIDGAHRAYREATGHIALQMPDVDHVERIGADYYLDTGSPHYVVLVADAHAVDTAQRGASIRYSDRFREAGTNVNFVSADGAGGLCIATYERGVEAETLACGTGVTAAALVHHLARRGQLPTTPLRVRARGGELQVHFRATAEGGFTDIWLIGPAVHVFTGTVSL